MIIRIRKKRKIKNGNLFVDPDEIFLDSQNLENFDRQQFEGRIEKAISKKTVLFLGVFFITSAILLSGRLGYLQIQKGEAYMERSQNNTLEKQILFSDRGIIYDRNKVELAWNKKDEFYKEHSFPVRSYLSPGFSHVLGYVSYPAKDKNDRYWQTEFIGKDGLEKQYNEALAGENGAKIVETDVRGNVHSENTVNNPDNGKDLITTIDSRLQKELFVLIKQMSERNSFTGGAGVIMNAENGEILVSTSFPEYSSEILSLGKESKIIEGYFKDNRKVFLDRTMSGLYTPGSIVKPFFALAALNENVIDPLKEILSTGTISIPNPYFPDLPSVFKDWKAHGWVDMRAAIAVSSDIYFYEVGGGFEDQKGVGIVNLERYARAFGIGQPTGVDLPDEKGGVIPSPEWKAQNFSGDPWRVGDTYNTAIGQYGFQVTPLEMTRAVSAIANYGTLPIPHYVLGDEAMNSEAREVEEEISDESYKIVQEGMRESVTYGTSVALNVPYVKVAAKTGTAQVGLSKNKVNSWIVGFFPYENPKYAFTILMEGGPSEGNVGASSIMRELLGWMNVNTPEYWE